MEAIKDKNENQQKIEQLKYDVFYKKQELEFAIAKNSSRHRNLGKNLEMCASGFKITLLAFLFLVVLGKIFSYLISIGDTFVTSAFGLLYLICGVFYFGLMMVLFYKTMESFMRWLENSDTKWGKRYCEKKGIFTMSMEQAECARQLIKQKKQVEILKEIEEELNGEIETSRLKECSYMVEFMEMEPEVPKGKAKASKEERRICIIIIVLLFLIFFFF